MLPLSRYPNKTMQYSSIPNAKRRASRSVSPGLPPLDSTPSLNEIPFDYVAKFTLTGIRGNRIQDVINISVEGAFVAVAIGYSLIPARPLILNPEALGRSPFRSHIEPFIEPAPSADDPSNEALAQAERRRIQQAQLIAALSQCQAMQLCGIDFKYSIIDSGSGRELQNQPIHNIAGLGESSGDRPFRPFARPMLFTPRSTIRIEIEEISEGPLYGYEDPQTRQRIGGELFMVLHGYKLLGYGGA